MQIHFASKKDVLQLSELFRQDVEYHQSQAGYYELIGNFDWITYTQERLNAPKGRIIVAEHDGLLAGFIYIRIIAYPSGSGHKSILQRIRRQSKSGTSLPIKPLLWGVIEECFILQSLRRQGIGSQLVQSATDWFKTNKISRIELSVIVRNKEGESFWEKLGFEPSRFLFSKTI
jgi:GNAT superfamily N-acetyltransferase